MNKNVASGFGIGIGIGLALGLALGILYAPKPGKETRELIKQKAANVSKEFRIRTGKAKVGDIKP